MSKINRNQGNTLSDFKTDWEIFPWTKEMYQKHESEFKIWIEEYRSLRKVYENDARLARWRWIEMKGGLKIGLDGDILPKQGRFEIVSAMFERMNDWVSFKEKREMTHEQRGEAIKSIFFGMRKPQMSIPQSVRDGAERDVAHEEQKIDEMTQSALDNF